MKKTRRGTSEKGAALVELSLCILLFFVTVYAIIEFGRFVYSYTVLAGATREAARYAIVHGSNSSSVATTDDIRTQVTRYAIGLDTSALAVSTTWDPSNAPGGVVRVQATYDIAPMTRLIFDQALSLSSRSEMVISQ